MVQALECRVMVKLTQIIVLGPGSTVLRSTFFGEIGLFVELPLPRDISNYEVYTSIENYIEFSDTKQEDNNHSTDNENLFELKL